MKKPEKQPKSPAGHTEAASPSDGDLQDRIRHRAYELWLQNACVPGRDVEHWLKAEEEFSKGQPDRPVA